MLYRPEDPTSNPHHRSPSQRSSTSVAGETRISFLTIDRGLNGHSSIHQYRLNSSYRGGHPNKNIADGLTQVRHYALFGSSLADNLSWRCGKTSIQEVLFKGLPPKDAFFIEPTTKVVKTAYESVYSSTIRFRSGVHSGSIQHSYTP